MAAQVVESLGDHTGLIYFVRGLPDGPIKIGVTIGHPFRRLAQLQAYSPAELGLLGLMHGGYAREREIHDRFAAIRLHGEWFRPGDDLLRFIKNYARLWPSVAKRPESRKIMGWWSPEDWRYERMAAWAGRTSAPARSRG